MLDDGTPSMQITGEEAKVVVALERAGASLSLIGVTLIVITFALFKRLRTVPNTFILFASIANIGASIASLIGLDGLTRGIESPLCRAQAFLLEIFMQSDPWWSFAMAFNVFLVFFYSASPMTFRRHLWAYCLVCFGLPLIPAVACLFITVDGRGAIYGDATLWCWISDDWNSLRIFTYYIPIWICIFLSVVIYIAVGYHVFHQRNQLRNLSLSNPGKETGSEPGFYGTVTTEVQITSDICDAALPHGQTPPASPVGSPSHCPWNDGPFPQVTTNIHAQRFQNFQNFQNGPNHLLRDEEMGGLPSNASYSSSPPRPLLPIHGAGSSSIPADYMAVISASPLPPRSPPPVATSAKTRFRHHHYYHPRKHHHHQPLQSPPQTRGAKPFTQQASSTITSTAPAAGHRHTFLYHFSPANRLHRIWYRITNKLQNMDPIKLAYLRTSFVFAISVLVTWTPSSINRIYTLLYPTRASYGLNIASATVLPLQGVWNAIIYFTTSWTLLGEEVHRTVNRSRWLRRLGARFGIGIETGAGGSMRLNGRARVLAGSVPMRSTLAAAGTLGRTANRTRLGSGSSDDSSLGGVGGDSVMRSAIRSTNSRHEKAEQERDSDHESRVGTHADDTDDESIMGHIGGGRSGRRLRPNGSPSASQSAELCLSARGTPPVGTLRVQKGGELDT